MSLKPKYMGSPIAHISSLCSLLECSEKLIKKAASQAENSYFSFILNRIGKKDREVFDAKPNLKKFQKLINSRIMSNVVFPSYLMGGIKDTNNKRDYFSNGVVHLGKETIISLDIVDFFPSIKKEKVFNIYKNLFRFSPRVSRLLTDLTTFNDSVPQGGCTSTYIANLVFFNQEFDIVKRLKNIGISYTRLLDDITLSSKRKLDKKEISSVIGIVNGMIRSHGLTLHDGKTKIGYVSCKHYDCNVTGVYVRGANVKMPKNKVAQIRSAVRECELSYEEKTPFSLHYHHIWNVASGRVAQLKRFKQREGERLRKRLMVVLPLYNEKQAKLLVKKISIFNEKVFLAKRTGLNGRSRLRFRKEYNIIMYKLGILARNNKNLSHKLRLNIAEV